MKTEKNGWRCGRCVRDLNTVLYFGRLIVRSLWGHSLVADEFVSSHSLEGNW